MIQMQNLDQSNLSWYLKGKNTSCYTMQRTCGEGRPERGLHTSGPYTRAEGTKTQVGGGTEAMADTGRGKPNHHTQKYGAKEKHLDQMQPGNHCGNNRAGLKCMYTNLDSYNNKRSELLARIAQYQPDVIGLTEIMPKHATWKLLKEDMTIQGYTAYVNFEHGGVLLYIRNEIRSEETKHTTQFSSTVWSSITLKNQDKQTL